MPEDELPPAVRDAQALITRYYCERDGHAPSDPINGFNPSNSVPAGDEWKCDCGAVTWVRKP